MYRSLKILVFTVSMILVSAFTIWTIFSISQPLPGGKVESIFVLNSSDSLPNDLKKIALDHHTLIAKQIIIPSNSPTSEVMGDYVFEKIGKGTLPGIYTEEKNKTIIKNSNNNTNYVIIGKNLNAKSLAKQLNALGNEVTPLTTNTMLEPIQTLKNNYLLPIIILLISFVSLRLAENISKIKENSVRILAGESSVKLIFLDLARDIRNMIIIFVSCIFIGIFYFLFLHHFWIPYILSFVLTLSISFGLFILVDIVLLFLFFILLSVQNIGEAIKGKTPMILIFIIIAISQTVAILSSMQSMTDVGNINHQIGQLQIAQKNWEKNKGFYAPTTIGITPVSSVNLKDLQNLFMNILKTPDTLFSYSTELLNATSEIDFDQNKNQLIPSESNWGNILYANPELLKRDKISLSKEIQKKISNFSPGEYALLIPEAKKNETQKIVDYWEKVQLMIAPYLSSHPIVSHYSKSNVFAYPIWKNQFTNFSNLSKPLIIVYSEKSFQKASAKQLANNIETYFSQGSLLIKDKQKITRYFVKNNLSQHQGSFFNGNQSVLDRLSVLTRQRNILLGVNIMCLLSSILLISLLHSIYLYQKRRESIIRRLSGESWLTIHFIYLMTITTLTAWLALVAKYLFQTSIMTLSVPCTYLLLMFLIFVVQMKERKKLNIFYLKGL